MSFPSARIDRNVQLFWTACFLAAYATASFLDLATTHLALARNDLAREANIAATTDGVFSAGKAMAITLAGGLVLLWMFWAGLGRSVYVGEPLLRRPGRAMLRLTLIPGMDPDKGRSSISLLSYAMAFVLLRTAAATNNAMIAFGRQGWISRLVGIVERLMPELAATIAVVGALYWMLAAFVSPLSAALVRQVRPSA